MQDAIPTNVEYQCWFDGQLHTISIAELKMMRHSIYKSVAESPIIDMRVTCPNCDKINVLKIPEAWLSDE